MPVPQPPVTPPAAVPGGTSSFTGLDIITQAMLEIGAIAQGETPTSAEAGYCLGKLNRMLDAWNADGRYVYAVNFLSNALIPGLQPHTVGPGVQQPGGQPPIPATWYANQRPIKLISAEIILNTSNPAIRYPMNVRDADWWAAKRAYQVAATLPTDVYYEPDWPNGSLYVWPVPNVNYPLEMQVWSLINQVQLAGLLSFPPGYMDAIVLSLAVSLCPSFEKPLDPTLAAMAIKAVKTIQGPNTEAPRIGTKDFGMPSGRTNRATFNYLTGSSS